MDAITENTFAAIIGKLKSLEYGLRALIVAHPNPQALNRAWQSLLPTIADVHTELPSFEGLPPMQRELQKGLALLTQQIELAAGR